MASVDEKLDRIQATLSDHTAKDDQHFVKIHDRLDEHGEALARIDERTKFHERRMDRADRRAVAGGAASGGAIAAVLAFAKHLFGGSGGGG